MEAPGGRREAGESLEQTAWRELREEFGVGPSSSAALHRFNVKTTKAVRGALSSGVEVAHAVCLAALPGSLLFMRLRGARGVRSPRRSVTSRRNLRGLESVLVDAVGTSSTPPCVRDSTRQAR